MNNKRKRKKKKERKTKERKNTFKKYFQETEPI
jgi:hypothetical protein